MKYLIYFVLFITITHSKIIEGRYAWASTTSNNAKYGAYCDMKYDTNTRNFSYVCKGVKLSKFNVYDNNGFVVGSASVYRDLDGYGNVDRINGLPSSLGGYGKAFDSTSFFMDCEYGYAQTSWGSHVCEKIPDNSHVRYESQYTGSVEWNCDDGYVDINGDCIKECKYNQVYLYGECENIPKHSYKTSYNDYECVSGYEYVPESNQKCVEICKAGMYRDENYNCKQIKRCKHNEIFVDGACYTIPKNSHKINFDEYACVDGYVQSNENGNITCEKKEVICSGFDKDSTDESCSKELGINFKEHCILFDSGKTSCVYGWQSCKSDNGFAAKELPLGVKNLSDDCSKIVECADGYTMIDGKCVQTEEKKQNLNYKKFGDVTMVTNDGKFFHWICKDGEIKQYYHHCK